MRRSIHTVHENHERWLVSYADFITLLFAFFVVMFASSQTDRKRISESVREALENGQLRAAFAGALKQGSHPRAAVRPPSTQEPPHPDLVESMRTLTARLQTELKAGKMEVKLERRGLVVSLKESAFFASGDDAVNPASYPIVEKVASVVKSLPNPVRLEGHTDAIPIHTPRFRSNWELSAARSIAMLELLSTRFAVPRERMAIAGYADNAPSDSNETNEGRARNRRVDLVLLAREGESREPSTQPAGSRP